ncbi:unnamed protein product [Schistocephalus solidus]|uniref:Type II toxin-antitoxin system PemK/MazF family toxin n=1 Tax=Schistocephalus solidus TaxID=70667 RepID=A0A183SI31_SCHSO|nr:unnamed protein product [Schistocephalus solidus]
MTIAGKDTEGRNEPFQFISPQSYPNLPPEARTPDMLIRSPTIFVDNDHLPIITLAAVRLLAGLDREARGKTGRVLLHILRVQPRDDDRTRCHVNVNYNNNKMHKSKLPFHWI